jgi:hypothetical protein
MKVKFELETKNGWIYQMLREKHYHTPLWDEIFYRTPGSVWKYRDSFVYVPKRRFADYSSLREKVAETIVELFGVEYDFVDVGDLGFSIGGERYMDTALYCYGRYSVIED